MMAAAPAMLLMNRRRGVSTSPGMSPISSLLFVAAHAACRGLWRRGVATGLRQIAASIADVARADRNVPMEPAPPATCVTDQTRHVIARTSQLSTLHSLQE